MTKATRAVVGVILAAGQGRRIGTPKVLLTWQGRFLVEWMIRIQSLAGIRHVVVVCPPDLCSALAHISHEKHRNTETITQVSWVAGDPEADAYSSLQRAWQTQADQCPAGFWVGPVDQGPYPVSLVQTMLKTCGSSTEWIGVPTYHGQRGHPVWLGGDVLPQLPASHSHGLRGVMQDLQHLVVEIPVQTPSILRNINHRELYHDFLQQIQTEELFDTIPEEASKTIPDAEAPSSREQHHSPRSAETL